MAQIELSVYLGDTIVTITADSIIDALKKKSIIDNLNTAITQENMSLDDATPVYYSTKDGYEYIGFQRHEDGAKVTFGKTREVPTDIDGQLFPKRIGSDNYTGFQVYNRAENSLQPA